MQTITHEISKELYNKLQSMSYEDQQTELFPDGVPSAWAIGYGYYGFELVTTGGRYYVTHKIGGSCD